MQQPFIRLLPTPAGPDSDLVVTPSENLPSDGQAQDGHAQPPDPDLWALFMQHPEIAAMLP